MWEPVILDVECIVCNKTLQKINHNPSDTLRKMGKINNNNRRSRTPNWSVDEKQCLLQLIKERKDVVVTKSNNGPNYSEEKDVAWNEILNSLAEKFGNKFSTISIKKVKTQWQNMKRIAREEIAMNGVDKCTRQTLEVCDILDLIKDGELKRDGENLNDSTITTNVEIKTEVIDEDIDINQACCSGISNTVDLSDIQRDPENHRPTYDSSASSDTDQISEAIEEHHEHNMTKTRQEDLASSNNMFIGNPTNDQPFQRHFQDFFRYTSAEKRLKLETLKEERQVVRAMRETAELNKIIAEQKLKHVLWAKKQDMEMMSSGRDGETGKAGAIREAGGAFGKMEAAREDEYFYKKQKEQIQNLKQHLDKEISFHQEQIKRHEDAIRRHKEQMANVPDKN